MVPGFVKFAKFKSHENYALYGTCSIVKYARCWIMQFLDKAVHFSMLACCPQISIVYVLPTNKHRIMYLYIVQIWNFILSCTWILLRVTLSSSQMNQLSNKSPKHVQWKSWIIIQIFNELWVNNFLTTNVPETKCYELQAYILDT